MGSKGSTATSTSGPPKEVLQDYQDVINQAKQVGQQPLSQYTGPTLAGFTPMQNQAFQGASGASSAYQPYFNQSSGLINQATQGYSPTQFSGDAVQQYMNPYTQNVINSTMANMDIENQKQQNSLQGNAIASGAWGGDRSHLAQNDLARQQSLANGQTIAGLENQNYQQALGQFNTQNQMGLQSAGLNANTALSGAGLEGALGNYSTQNALNAAGTQFGLGQQQQQLVQNQLNIPYQQFQQQQQYPFQTTQWLANMVEGLGNGMGQQSSTTQPGPSGFSQAAGLGLGIAGLFVKDGGRIQGMAAGGVPDFSLNIIPDAQSVSQHGVGYLPPPQIDDSEANQDSANMQNGMGILSKAMHNRKPTMKQGDMGAGLSPTIQNSLDDFTNKGLAGIGSGGDSKGVLPDWILHPDGMNASMFGSTGWNFADGGVAPTGPGTMHEVTGFNPIVAGTPVYGFTPPNASNGQVISTLGSSLDPVKPAVDPATKASRIHAGGFNQFSSALSNPDFVSQFNSKYTNDLPAGVGTDRRTLRPFYQEYRQNPFEFSFADGGDVQDESGIAALDPNVTNIGNLRVPGQSTGFAAFDSPKAGLDAMVHDITAKVSGHSPAMRARYGDKYVPTLESVISTYAPPEENNTADYIKNVAQWTGIDPTKPLSVFDVNRIVPAMARMENGKKAGQFASAGLGQDGLNPDAQAIVAGMNQAVPGSGIAAADPNSPVPAGGLVGPPMPQQKTAQANTGIMSDASQAQPQSPQALTDLQKELAQNEPQLDKGLALSQAGFAMMAGKSPFAGVNIGEGALAGLKGYASQKEAVREYKLKEIEAEKAAQQLYQQTQYHNEEIKLRQEQIDQGKYSTVAGYGQDDTGNSIPGAYQINTKTGEAKFIPGMQLSSGIGKSPVAQLSQRLQAEHPDWTPERVAEEATRTLETGKQSAKVGAAADSALQKGIGTDLAKTQKEWGSAATAAQLGDNYIQSMQNEASKFRQGWGSDAQRSGKQILQGIASTLGIDTPDLDESLGSQQAFNKTAMQMVMDKTRQVSSRAAYSEMQAIQSGMPTETMAAKGFDLVTSQMHGVNQYQKALAKIITDPDKLQAYKDAHKGSMSGFDMDVLDKVSPAVFWLKAMPADDRAIVIKNMKEKEPDKYRDLLQKTKYAKDNGLI